MISPKKQNVTLKELKVVKIIRPDEAGGRWKPVPHHELVEELKKKAKERGWKLKRPRCVLSNSEGMMVVSFDVIGPPPPRKGTVPSLGAVNSTNQRERLWLFAGVWLEDEKIGLPLARISVTGRRTTRLDLPARVKEAMDCWGEEAGGFPTKIKRLEEKPLTCEKAKQLIYLAGVKGYISDSRVMKIHKDIDQEEEAPSKWKLLLKFAEWNRIAPPLDQMDNTYSFLKEVLGD